jgi:hypothetical protein
MPKSKRAKVVHLSKVDKKGKELSEKLYNGVREAADEYPFIFVFKVENMRNNYLKEVRMEFSDSRYVLYSVAPLPHTFFSVRIQHFATRATNLRLTFDGTAFFLARPRSWQNP